MSTTSPEHQSTASEATEEPTEVSELKAQIELLQRENERLRTAHARVHQTTHQRTAVGFLGIGILAIVAGVVFTAERDVLFALGATGLFAGVLIYYLTPESFVSADIGERVYEAIDADRRTIRDELGLTGEAVYVPRESESRLYVPQQEKSGVPDRDDLDSFFVVGSDPADRGVAFRPSGLHLVDEFERSVSGPLASDPAGRAEQAADALVEVFELADGVDVEAAVADGRITLEIANPVYGELTRSDHPVVSFVALVIADAVNTPVEVEHADRSPAVVTFRWATPEEG